MRNPLQKAPLRKRAEERLEGLQEAVSRTGVDIEWLVHELRVHQIELELQNEEMNQIKARLETGWNASLNPMIPFPLDWLASSAKE
jgi:hypothetical protein